MVAGRGARVGSGGSGGAWPRRQAACRQAAEQKRCRPTGTNARPQRGQPIDTISLRHGLSTIPGLRSSGLGPPLPQLIRERPLAELVQPFAFGAVRPHDPALQAAGFLVGLDPTASDPVLECAFREPEGLPQFSAPPFIRAQLSPRAGPRVCPTELQPPTQVMHRLYSEGPAPRWPVPGRVQALGDARGRQALVGPAPNPLADVRIRTQVAVVPNGPDHSPRRRAAPDPADGYLHPLALPLGDDHHGVHDLADQLLAVSGGGGRRRPQGRDVGRQLADRRALGLGERPRLLLPETMVGLFELLLRQELCFPLLLQGARHQAVLRFDRIILAAGALGFVGGPFAPLLPQPHQFRTLVFQPFRRGERQLQSRRLQRRQDVLAHEGIERRGGYLLAVRRPVVARVPRAHIGGAGSRPLVAHDHARATPPAAYQAGQQRPPTAHRAAALGPR